MDRYTITVDYADKKNANWTSGYMGGQVDSIEEARRQLQSMIDYYEDIGDTIFTAKIETVCGTCKGVGRMTIKRVSKPCPECNGEPLQLAEQWINRPFVPKYKREATA